MPERSRYRVEDGRWCIDLRVRQARQLFDSRDPAPFRERDLDADAMDYLLGAAQEIPRHQPIAIAVRITEPGEPTLTDDVILDAMRAHLGHQIAQASRRQAEQLRRGRGFLAIGITVLAILLTLAELTKRLPPGAAREILREGLVITGWVAMWRPLEALIYDWRPFVDERRQLQRLLDAPVSVRRGADA